MFERKKQKRNGEKLRFEGVSGKAVYNITVPLEDGGKTYLAGRVEALSDAKDTRVVFFAKKDGVWEADPHLPSFPLEDPFHARLDGEIVFGGVETYLMKNAQGKESVGYRTVFYRGEHLTNLKRFATGPDMMKDIRLVSLQGGKIGVFTRPQGEVGGKGTIGFVELNSLDELTPEKILEARLLEGQFKEGEWGGVNEAHLLPDGRVGVIGHVAHEDENGGKHYAAMSFVFDPRTFRASPLKIIAERKDFPPGRAKNSKLKDVVFPGGYADHALYVGLSDAEAGRLEIPDPFL